MSTYPLGNRLSVRVVGLMLSGILALLCSSSAAFSQGATGTINGTITAAAGGPVGGAMVSVIDVARGETHPLTADSSGLYSTSGLTPGLYTVRVEAMGFKTSVHTGITVPTGATLTVDFVLQPGATSEVVTITAEVLPANAASMVENRSISETPVNGRSVNALTENRATGQSTLPGSAPNGQSASGQRTDQNNPLIDGILEGSINTGWQEFNGQFQANPDPDLLVPLDSVGEINNTTYPNAQYGYHLGNTQNIGIKSGTNNLHGSAYAFGRDADLDARNPFNSAPGSTTPGLIAGKTAVSFEQWGASVGGKVKKDTLFYFLNFERVRYNVGATSLINSFTDFDLANGVDSAASNSSNAANSVPDAIYTLLHRTPSIVPNQLQMNVAGCGGLVASTLSATTTLAQINAGCATGVNLAPNGTGSFGTGFAAPLNLFNNYGASSSLDFGVPTIGGPDTGVAKMDYRINSKNSMNGELMVGNGQTNAWTKVSVQPWWIIDSGMRAYLGRVVWVYTPNSSIVNEARFGFDLFNGGATPSDCAGKNGAPSYITAWGFNSGGFLPCQIPMTTISGFTALRWSGGGNGPYTTHTNNWIGIDNVSYTRGKHIFKFGVEIRRGIFVEQTGGGGNGPQIGGTLSYGSVPAFSGANVLEDYLTGTSGNATIYTGSATGNVKNLYTNYYAGFLQDTMRITRRFSVDLGVRYEFQPPYSQQNNLLGSFNLGQLSGLGQEQAGQPLYGPDTWKHNLGPRGGLAWDVKGNGKTVVRVNGGIYYGMTTLSGLSGMQNVPNGATFVSPLGPTGGVCGSYSNGTTSAATTPGTGGFTGLCTFANAAGENGITQGTISTSTPLLYNVCNPSLTAYGSAAIDCTGSNNTHAVYGALVSKGLTCGDGLPVTPNALSGLASALVTLNPPPCAIQYTEPNLYSPYVTKWQASVQQALGRNISLIFTYNGNHGTGIRQLVDINQPAPGLKNKSFTATGGNIYTANLEQDARPFTTNCPNGTVPGVTTGQTSGPCLPWLAQVFVVGNSDVSNYNAGVATLSVRGLHGVSGNFNYTLAHCMDIFSGNENIWVYLSNTHNPRQDYGTCLSGTPQRITGNMNWNLPSHHAPLQMLQGWSVNGTVTLLPRRYAAFTDTSNDLSGVGNGPTQLSLGDKWDIFGTPRNFNTFGLTSISSPGSTIPCYGVSSAFSGAGCTGPNGNTTVTIQGNTYTVPNLGPGGICTTDALSLPNSPATVPTTQATLTAGNGGSASYTLPQNTAMYNLIQYGCYSEGGSVMLPGAQGTFGDMSRNCCLQPGFFEVNGSITKTWGFLKEQRLKMQFRAEAFNLFNRVNYSGAALNLGSPKGLGSFSTTPNTGDEVVIGVGGPRAIQLGLKFLW